MVLTVCLALVIASLFTTVAMADIAVMLYTNGSHTFDADWTESKIDSMLMKH